MLVKIRDFIRKYKQLTFFFGLAIVGAVFIFAAVLSFSKPKVEGIEVEATIVDIIKEDMGTNADGYTEFSYTVYVDYTDKDGNVHNRVIYPVHEDDMVVGNKIMVEYNPNNPSELIVNNSLIANILFLVVGVAALVGSIIKIVSVIKKKDINEFNKVDMNNIPAEKIESVKNNKEEEKEYYFHFTGTANQSYVLETLDRNPVYEARCDKIGIVSKYKFTFINHLTGKETEHLVSHVLSESFDSFVTSSKFKIDDVNVWDILGKEGYSLDPHFNGVKSYFDIYRYGIKVAKIELAGTKAYKDGASKLLGDVPIQGMFKVYAKESDIDMVFLCAFILSKVELF